MSNTIRLSCRTSIITMIVMLVIICGAVACFGQPLPPLPPGALEDSIKQYQRRQSDAFARSRTMRQATEEANRALTAWNNSPAGKAAQTAVKLEAARRARRDVSDRQFSERPPRAKGQSTVPMKKRAAVKLEKEYQARLERGLKKWEGVGATAPMKLSPPKNAKAGRGNGSFNHNPSRVELESPCERVYDEAGPVLYLGYN